MTTTTVNITGQTLAIDEVVAVAYQRATVQPLNQETKQCMEATQHWLRDEIGKKETVFYGINTGFGSGY